MWQRSRSRRDEKLQQALGPSYIFSCFLLYVTDAYVLSEFTNTLIFSVIKNPN